MSISQLFPEEGPTLNLNFAGSKTLDPRITFSRTSTATYMDDSGLIKVAPADAPRFDHRYVNGEIESLGLLVEESRVNSLRYSNDFSQTNWTKQNSHPVPTQDVVGPDGVSNSGWRFYRTATNQYIYQSILGAGTHTLSAWVRSSAATGSFIMSAYNAINGTMATTFTATNEWQRFSITISPTTNTNYYPCTPTSINTDFYVWGAQLELNGSFPTSYIPTSGGTATRNPDNVSMTGDNFSNWYNPTEGTIVLDCTPVYDNSSNQYRRLLSIHNNSGAQTDVIQFIQTEATNQVLSSVWDGASPQSGFGKTLLSGTRHKVAFAVKENNMNASYDGNIGTDDTSATLPVMTEMDIGSYSQFSGNRATAHYNSLRYYPTRLTNTQLQTLTK